MYNSILVPISFDENSQIEKALSVAQKLAAPDAVITLLHVIEQTPGYAISYLPADYLTQTRKAVEAELKKHSDSVPGSISRVISGHSARTILDFAKDNGSDLIVIASHRPGMQDLLLGSTATTVVRHAQCSVHILR